MSFIFHVVMLIAGFGALGAGNCPPCCPEDPCCGKGGSCCKEPGHSSQFELTSAAGAPAPAADLCSRARACAFS